MIVGPTRCRKTTFLQRLPLENVDLFESRPHRVRYYYGLSQDKFDNLQRYGMEFHKGVPSHDNIKKMVWRYPRMYLGFGWSHV